MRKIISIISLILFAYFYGQDSNDASKYIPKIAPPSPEAFKFSNYGNIPIGLFTGSSNINIPITEYKAGEISIPISLNYSSNGIKVDETNGSVGLGWTFINAGVITRTVRDMPDEDATERIQVDIDKMGLWNYDVINYIKKAEESEVDTEPDLYSANFVDIVSNLYFLLIMFH